MTRDDHLFGDGPKRLLALDGGGIRGALTLGYLGRIETILRERAGGDPDFRLCDYFDLIGGTSTGSIIATGLALGFSVTELDHIYRELASKVFVEGFLRFGVFGAKFPTKPLVDALTRDLGDRTLASDELRTGLMVMAKRLDTGSPWLFHNNPRGRYFVGRGGRFGNGELLLRTIVRASAAAPHYFEPEVIGIAPGVTGAFVDGAVSPYNNPALQLLMLATLRGYGLNWPMGEDQLLLASVGTGFRAARMAVDDVADMPALRLAAQSIMSIMADANWQGQAILQWMSRTPTAWSIDSEVGDLADDELGAGANLLTYLRYEVAFDPDWMRDVLGESRTDGEWAELFAMDEPRNVVELGELGRRAARIQVRPEHFPKAFDR